jgi:hypothetical protein
MTLQPMAIATQIARGPDHPAAARGRHARLQLVGAHGGGAADEGGRGRRAAEEQFRLDKAALSFHLTRQCLPKSSLRTNLYK